MGCISIFHFPFCVSGSGVSRMEKETRKTQIKCKDCVRIWTMVFKGVECRDFLNMFLIPHFFRQNIFRLLRKCMKQKNKNKNSLRTAIGHKHIWNRCCILGFVFRYNDFHLIVISQMILFFTYSSSRTTCNNEKFHFSIAIGQIRMLFMMIQIFVYRTWMVHVLIAVFPSVLACRLHIF